MKRLIAVLTALAATVLGAAVIAPAASAAGAPPPAPTNVTVVYVTQSAAYLRWDAVQGAGPVGYTILAAPGGIASSSWTPTQNLPNSVDGYIRNLTFSDVYSITVVATNAYGDSPPSAPVPLTMTVLTGPVAPSSDAVYLVGAPVVASYAPADASAVLKVAWSVDGHEICYREFDPFECGVDEGFPPNLIDTSKIGAHVLSVKVWDTELNTGTSSHFYYVVNHGAPDTTAPSATITAPAPGATYQRGAHVLADYGCRDEVGGSGVVHCSGTVGWGTAIDTTTPGLHTFSVTAVDDAGHTTTVDRTYTVTDDPTPPTVTLTVPADGATYDVGEYVSPQFSCSDDPGGSGVASCVGSSTLVGGWSSDMAPIDTSTEGLHWYAVHALDRAGNLTTVEHTYVVGTAPTGDLPPTDVPPSGGTVTTDTSGGGATTEVPVQTAITLPASDTGGTVEVSSGSVTEPAPTGYSFLGQQITITTSITGTQTAPLVLHFTIEGTTPGLNPDTLGIVRTENGVSVPVQQCTGATGEAFPDPCMTPPDVIDSGPGAGDVEVTVYTTHASDWNFAAHVPYTVGGFFQPVDNRPTLNLTTGGSAIPVKFSLGGNQGLQVFARGFPASGQITCGTDATVDAIEQTVTANASGLTYDAKSGQYTYTWKTQKAWAGTCRQLELMLNDGSVMRANFKFK